jgi:hypothetical protein
MAEIGAEGLLRTASQIVLLDRRQLKGGLSQSPTEDVAAGRAEAGSGPGIGVGTPDSEIDNGQPPYGGEASDHSRIACQVPHQARGPAVVRPTVGQIGGGEKLVAAITELSPLKRHPNGATVHQPAQTRQSGLPAPRRLSRCWPHIAPFSAAISTSSAWA